MIIVKKDFRFVETQKSVGFVEKLRKLAKESGRSLNNYVEQIFKRHLDKDS
jgi:hypothetical protein